MPTRKKVTEETIIDAPELSEIDASPGEIIDVPDEESEPEDVALAGLLTELRGGSEDATVNVYRQAGRGKRLSFMFATTPDEYTGGELMEKIRDDFGPGDYRVHVREGRRLVANRPLSIAEPAKKEESQITARPEIGVNEIVSIMTAQMQSQQAIFMQTMQTIAESLRGVSQQQPSVDPLAMQRSVMETLVSMKGLVEQQPAKDPTEILMQGITLAKDLVGKDGETNSSDILLEAVKTFAPTISATAMQPKHTNPPIRGPDGTSINALSGPPNNLQLKTDAQKEREMLMKQSYLKSQLSFLLNLAKDGKDPELYAEVILDQMEVDQVLEFIGKDDALDRLIAIDGKVVQYKDWFLQLKDAIVDLTTPKPEDDNENMSEGGPVAIQHIDSDSPITSDT